MKEEYLYNLIDLDDDPDSSDDGDTDLDEDGNSGDGGDNEPEETPGEGPEEGDELGEEGDLNETEEDIE